MRFIAIRIDDAKGRSVKTSLILMTIFLTACLGPPYQAPSADAGEDQNIGHLGLSLLARVGVDDFEHAAFIARDGDGSLRLIEWPWTHGFRSTEWRGPLPPNVVAIIHTHPKQIPLPSDRDVRTAMRLKIPVFALTPRSVCAATATGEVRCAPMPQR